MGIAADFVLVVVAALAGGLLARLLRLPLLIGYIAAGVVVGPYTAGPTVSQIHDLELLAEIGVALLLFSLGLEVSFRDLAPVRRMAVSGAPLQIALTILLGGLAAFVVLGLAWTEAGWLGAMISLSSTMVVLKLLSAQGLSGTLAHRLMIGILVMQDLAVVPMLIVLPQLGNWEGAWSRIGLALLKAGVFLAGAWWTGNRFLPPLLGAILRWGGRELFLVAVLAAGVGVGYAGHLVGLSFALGAFLAGLVLSESDLSHQALSDVVPLRDVFGLLFFVTVGMLFDPRYALAHPVQVAIMSVIIIIGKAAITGGLTAALGYGRAAAWTVGLGLSQIGEFSFVLARAGSESGALSKDSYDLALACTLVTMVISPLSLALGMRMARSDNPTVTPDSPSGTTAKQGHVLVAGWGRTGRAVTRVAQAAGLDVLVLELDHTSYRAAVESGVSALWGDVTQASILEAAGIHTARALVLAVPDLATVQLAAHRAKHENAGIPIIARAVRDEHRAMLQHAGVDVAIQPEFEGGLAMAAAMLSSAGKQPDEVTALMRTARGNAG